MSVSHKWARGSMSIARTLQKSELSGLLSKNIVLSYNEVAVIVKNRVVEDVVESRKIKIEGLLKPRGYFKDVEVVMMDTSPKDTNWYVGKLWTNDQHEVSAKGLLKYRIADPKQFFSMVYAYSSIDKKGEKFLTLEDINNKIKSEVLIRVLQPEARSVEIDEIYGNREFQIRIENELELQLKQTLDMWGIELITFTSEWDLGDYADLVMTIREFEKEENLKELDILDEEMIRAKHSIFWDDGQEHDKQLVDELRTRYCKLDEENVIVEQQLKMSKTQIERKMLEDEEDIKAAQEALELKKEIFNVKESVCEYFPRKKEVISCFCKISYYYPMCLLREFKLSIYISQLKEEIDKVKNSDGIKTTSPQTIRFRSINEDFLIVKVISAVCDISPNEREINYSKNINSVYFKILPKIIGEFEVDIEIYYENKKIKDITIPIKVQEKPIEMPLDGICTLSITEKQVVYFSIIGTIITVLSANLSVYGILLLATVILFSYILWRRRPSEKMKNDSIIFS